MGAQQIPIQLAIACLLGSANGACPIVTFSRTIEEFAFQLPSRKSATIVLPLLPLAFECDNIPVAKSSSKQKLVDAYHSRPTEGMSPLQYRGNREFIPWNDLWLGLFLSWFYLSKVPTQQEKDRRRPRPPRWDIDDNSKMVLAKHKKQIVIATVPFITSDPTDERSAYARLLLWFPHRHEKELLEGRDENGKDFIDLPQPAVAALHHKWDQLSSEARTSWESNEHLRRTQKEFCTNKHNQDENIGDSEDISDLLQDNELASYEDDIREECGSTRTVVHATLAAPDSHGVVCLRHEAWCELHDFAKLETDRVKLEREQEEEKFNEARAIHHSADHIIADFNDDRTSPYEVELNRRVLELSSEQLDAYKCVVSYVQPTQDRQLLAIWGGEGGVGKSHVLRAAALYVQLQYGYNALVVTAVTNRAANLVKGVTTEHLFHFNAMKNVHTKKGLQAWKTSIASIRTRFETVKLMLIDEKSVVNLEMLYEIHILLTHAFPEAQGLPFAGISIVLIGDYYQLPPVQGHVPYKNPSTTSEKAWRGRELLTRYFTVYSEFTTPNYRQRDDPGYCAICRCARMATAPTQAMLAALNARVVTIEEAKQKTAPTALWTASTHRVKDILNISQLTDLKKQGATFFNIYAKHFRLTTTTTADASAPPTGTRKRALADMLGHDDLGCSATETPSLSNDGISNDTRRALLEYNPLLNKDGSRKKSAQYYAAQNSLQPHESFAIGCRVAVT